MPKPTISTGTGDDGTTGLLKGKRVSKDSPRVHAIGAVDELNAVLGVALTEELPPDLRSWIRELQRTLFVMGAELAVLETNGARVEAAMRSIEEWAAACERSLPPLRRFIIPGGCRAAALLHQARAICRRAERWVAALGAEERAEGPVADPERSRGECSRGVDPALIIFFNRLSDALFLAARRANEAAGYPDVEV